MQKELVSLFSRVSVPGVKSAEKPFLKEAQAINLEAALYGYALTADVIDTIASSSAADVAWFRKSLDETLSQITGSHVTHAALHNKFPYEVPEQREYMNKRIIGLMQSMTGQNGSTFTSLSCGHFIDSRVFGDLSNFSACPICQYQVDELQGADEVRHAFQSLTPFKLLELADERFVRDRAFSLIARNSSMSEDERHFVHKVIDTGVFERWNRQVPETIYRENLPFAYLLAAGDLERVRPLIKSATDVLRIAVYLSDADGDLSLKEKTLFKVKTSDRKALLALLNDTPNLREDMLRHRSEWLRFDKHVGFGTPKNKIKYPNAWDALQILRVAPHSIETFNRTVEKGMRRHLIDDEFLKALSERPGEFLRRLDFILRETTVTDDVRTLASLAEVSKRATTDALMGLWKYLQFRATYASERLFFPKGSMTKMQVQQDRRKTIKRDRLKAARDVLEAEINARFSSLPAMGKVYIAPELENKVVSFNRRADSSSSKAMNKGSVYPLQEGPVIRLFVWWKANVDVDLTAGFLDEAFRMVESCSFSNTQIRGLEVIHSGDVQSAPNGGSEFIDFEPEKLAAAGIRYVVPNMIVYSDENFDTFPSFAGYMVRDTMKSGKKFEAASVEFKFDLNNATTTATPFAFDLKERKLIYMDLAGKAGRHQTINGLAGQLSQQLRLMIDLPKRKLTVGDVVNFHARARGLIVTSKDDADLVVTEAVLKGVDVMNSEEMSELV